VLATASSDSHDLLRELGADVTIDYRKNDAAEIALRETKGQGADAAFDIEGANIVARWLAGIRPFLSGCLYLAPARRVVSSVSEKHHVTRHLSYA
jgi:NADPH:quinone reductase-like Zn-dependent oxidoreductase